MNRFVFHVVLVTALLLGGCAKHYNPEEVCTGKWIKPRVDQAMSDFKNKAKSAMGLLQGVSSHVAQNGQLGKLDMVTAMISLASLVTEFKHSQAIHDLRILSKTCDDPKLVSKAFSGYLKEQGAPQSVIDLLDQVEAFQKLIADEAGSSV